MVFRELQPRIGFPWATRVIGFMALGSLLISIAIMKQRTTPATKRRIFDLAAWKEAPYGLFGVGAFFGFLGLYIPFFYIIPYAVAKTGTSVSFAFYLVSILNASSFFGRIIPNYIADIVGPFNVLIPCMIMAGVLAFCWIAVHNVAGIVAFAIFYGFFSGTFVSLPASIIGSLSPDLKSVGARMGMLFSVAGFGVLIGSPIGGTILNIVKMDYLHAQIFCGLTVLAGGLFIALARIAKVGPSLMAKA